MSERSGRLFDRYVVVDWSANSKPKSGVDSIWVGSASRDGIRAWDTENPPTRIDAQVGLRDRLSADIILGRRVLVGFDFPLGYPFGFAKAICPGWREAWLGVWKSLQRTIGDTNRNENNRFEVANEINRMLENKCGPFWGHPNGAALSNLSWDAGDRKSGLKQYRHTETRVSGVQEVWKLYGQGSVGSQALLGIPVVARLWNHLGPDAEVWPFERGFAIRPVGPTIVLVEIWPGVIPVEVPKDKVKDQVQVEMLAAHFKRLDEQGELAALFGRPDRLSDRELDECVSAEGWILGT